MPSMLSRLIRAPTGYEKLQRREGYRIRVGRYHVVYTVDQGQFVIETFTLGARGGVYKKEGRPHQP